MLRELYGQPLSLLTDLYQLSMAAAAWKARVEDGEAVFHLVFRRPPFKLFRNTSVESLRTNRLVLHIQPEEGISLRFGAKVPGPVMRHGAVEMPAGAIAKIAQQLL